MESEHQAQHTGIAVPTLSEVSSGGPSERLEARPGC